MYMIRVGVLRGGEGDTYEQSLAHGALVLRSLPKDRYRGVDIFVDRLGVWHAGGLPVTHDTVKNSVDVVYDTTGQYSRILEVLGIPHVHLSSFLSPLGENRFHVRSQLKKYGVRSPQSLGIVWEFGDEQEVVEAVTKVFRSFAPPYRVQAHSRTVARGSVRCATREELHDVLLRMASLGVSVVVREEVMGTPAQVLVAPGFRNVPAYTFMPVHESNARLQFTPTESQKIQDVAKEAHTALGLKSYCTVQAVITKQGRVYITDIEACPQLDGKPWVQNAFEKVGASFGEFFHHLICQIF